MCFFHSGRSRELMLMPRMFDANCLPSAEVVISKSMKISIHTSSYRWNWILTYFGPSQRNDILTRFILLGCCSILYLCTDIYYIPHPWDIKLDSAVVNPLWKRSTAFLWQGHVLLIVFTESFIQICKKDVKIKQYEKTDWLHLQLHCNGIYYIIWIVK